MNAEIWVQVPAVTPFIMTNTKKIKIGQVFIDEGLLNGDDVERILNQQNITHQMFGEIAVELGLIDEKQLLECLVIQSHIPYIDLKQYDIDPDLFLPYPKLLLKRCIAIPIEKIGNTSVFAISQPLTEKTKEEIEELAGGKIFFVLSQMSVIREVVENIYKILKRKQEESSDLTELGKLLIDKEKNKKKKKSKKKSSD